MDKEKYVVVIGAANIDIGGTAYKELIPADSNQGIITISFGGVGRNIAYNLAKLGVNVVFITALGDDTLGKDLLNHCKDSGINTDYVMRRIPSVKSECQRSVFFSIAEGEFHFVTVSELIWR